MILEKRELYDLKLNHTLLHDAMMSGRSIYIGSSNYFVSRIYQTPKGMLYSLTKRPPFHKIDKSRKQKGKR